MINCPQHGYNAPFIGIKVRKSEEWGEEVRWGMRRGEEVRNEAKTRRDENQVRKNLEISILAIRPNIYQLSNLYKNNRTVKRKLSGITLPCAIWQTKKINIEPTMNDNTKIITDTTDVIAQSLILRANCHSCMHLWSNHVDDLLHLRYIVIWTCRRKNIFVSSRSRLDKFLERLVSNKKSNASVSSRSRKV